MQTQSSDSTSRSLLRRARERDPAAWEKLAAVYSPLVYHWCRRAGLQGTDAADVSQDVFRSVATALDGFRKEKPEDTFRGWLWTITRNKIRDFFRKRAQEPPARGGSSAHWDMHQLPVAAPDDAQDPAGAGSKATLAHRAIALMKSDFAETTWQAFWQTAVDQRVPQEVARDLDISVASVYQARSRVLRRLRQELEGLDLVD